jgi:Delta7-sterol 5-desaturase
MTTIALIKHFYFFFCIAGLYTLALILYWLKKPLAPYKIDPEFASLPMLLRDGFISAFVTFAAIPAALLCLYFFTHKKGFSYMSISQYGYPYFFISILLVIVSYDFYFYWSHRLLHTRLFFKYVHALHHKSRNITILTFFAVHPIELCVMSLAAPITLFLFPVCPEALIIGQMAHILYAIYGHCGYDFIPHKGLGRWINTAVCHYNHHQGSKTHYGFYSTFWDKLFNTLEKK